MSQAEKWLRRLVAQYEAGEAQLPTRMGLSQKEWRILLRHLCWVPSPEEPQHALRQALLSELSLTRLDEREQLSVWLFGHMVEGAAPLHRIIASASLGFNHLWQDLGLASRAELRQLMTDCFPELVTMNVNNMRWKKFFYRQRCLHSEGEVLCRSPSCDDCCEWAYCFAAET